MRVYEPGVVTTGVPRNPKPRCTRACGIVLSPMPRLRVHASASCGTNSRSTQQLRPFAPGWRHCVLLDLVKVARSTIHGLGTQLPDRRQRAARLAALTLLVCQRPRRRSNGGTREPVWLCLPPAGQAQHRESMRLPVASNTAACVDAAAYNCNAMHVCRVSCTVCVNVNKQLLTRTISHAVTATACHHHYHNCRRHICRTCLAQPITAATPGSVETVLPVSRPMCCHCWSVYTVGPHRTVAFPDTVNMVLNSVRGTLSLHCTYKAPGSCGNHTHAPRSDGKHCTVDGARPAACACTGSWPHVVAMRTPRQLTS